MDFPFDTVITKEIRASREEIGPTVEFVEKQIREDGERRERIRFLLVFEEMLVQLCENAPDEETKIRISIRRGRKQTSVKLRCAGAKFTLEEVQMLGELGDLVEVEEEQSRIISSMIFRLSRDRMSIRHSRGINHVVLTLHPRVRQNNTLLGIAAGAVLGLLLRFLLPTAVSQFLIENVITVVSNLFLRAIKMLLVPVIFFSITDCISGFPDYRTFGRIGGKVIVSYFVTTIIAMWLSYGVVQLMQPGSSAIRPEVQMMVATAVQEEVTEVSVQQMLTSFVPSNLLRAFFDGETLQIVFFSVLFGIAGNLLGESSQAVQNFVRVGNEMFSKITELVVSFLPFSMFCIMTSLFAQISAAAVRSLLYLILVLLCCFAGMLIVYSLLFTAVAHISPVGFFRHFLPAIRVGMQTCSSSAAMPVTMQSLDQMGVSPKMYGFAIPLGATINMDGASICLTVLTLFMARVFGVELSFTQLVTLFLTILLLSIASPTAPGAGIACEAALLAQIGVPAEAVCFTLAVQILSDFLATASNIAGDGVVTAVIAQTEGMLDLAQYHKEKI